MIATFLLGMYFLPVAVLSSGGGKQVTTLPEHMTLYMGLLYIIFNSLVWNIGCGIDKAILDLL